MSKVTSKLQVTIPKRLADEYGIAPGDEIDWMAAGEAIRLVPVGARAGQGTPDIGERLRIFDAATARQRKRERSRGDRRRASKRAARGWAREELYRRGRAG